MYGWIWSKLPGPVWLRVIISIALVAGVLAVLVTWVFPAIDLWLNNEEVTLDE